jgi:hypothetical protein
MTPTDLELQKLLAEELPELIGIVNIQNRSKYIWVEIQGRARIWGDQITSREWLWITAECEKKLKRSIHYGGFKDKLLVITEGYFLDATWQQRCISYMKTIGKL